jgi:2-aminoadipate transaminase
MTNFAYARRVLSALPGHYSEVVNDVISLDDGLAYPDGLPHLAALAEKVLSTHRTEALQYGPSKGLPELRRWVSEYVREDGVQITPERVLIVNGAKHGLDLVCKVFLDPGDSVVVTKPTYQTGLPILRGYEVDFLEVAQDSEGLMVEELEDQLRARTEKGRRLPKLVYNVPEFHNPTGVSMSERRRIDLVRAARRWNMIIVEDDPYRRIRFEGHAVRPIQAFDESDCVIGLGTFAKILAPGLRVGWINAAPEIIGRMAALKSDGGTCPLTQRIILEYCQAGELASHIDTMKQIYVRHRDTMIDSLSQQLPGVTATKPEGGYYLWVRLPEGLDSQRLLSLAIRHGVNFLPSRVFYATEGPPNYLRLAYSYVSLGEIREGIRRLGAAVAEMTVPEESALSRVPVRTAEKDER